MLPAKRPVFSWRLVAFFAANPLALLVPTCIGVAFKVALGGGAFSLTLPTVGLGAALALPLYGFMSLPLEKLPGLAALEEVNVVTRFLGYLLFGSRRGLGYLLKVVVASAVVSAAAGFGEELFFRGFLQTGLSALLLHAGLPAGMIAAASICATSILFGLLHSYSSSPAYQVLGFIASAYFGTVFLLTDNIVVPIVSHFVVDLIAFVQAHVKVAYQMSDEELEELWACDQPIALTMRMAAGYDEGGGAAEGKDEAPQASD
jgi:membrane protease YdiL (CAAX protease family)